MAVDHSEETVYDRRYLETYFAELRDVLVGDLKDEKKLPSALYEKVEKLINYTLVGGKLNRGVAVVTTLANILGDNMNEQMGKRAAILGWCMEWMQASFLAADDIMDEAITRRGDPCWYKVDKVGLSAINDAMMLLTHIDILLMKYFKHEPALFMRLHAILAETTYQTEIGQTLDMETQPLEGEIDLNEYTLARYFDIVQFKTAYYTIYAPVALGMVLGGVTDQAKFDAARKICIRMGVYFQVQDDYLDVYGTPEQIGKIGTDIIDGKCSWLVCTALVEASETQREVLFKNYARKDEACERKIKELFTELKLPEKYAEYEESSYEELNEMIKTSFGEDKQVPVKVFTDVLARIFKRKK
mmetsp:Transcript_19191/g.31475  ORF Transcript_19191/g.31475 Transcript_19191/m.31475 type:complete len:358 (-) Transcript_19191:36-1109(-)